MIGLLSRGGMLVGAGGGAGFRNGTVPRRRAFGGLRTSTGGGGMGGYKKLAGRERREMMGETPSLRKPVSVQGDSLRCPIRLGGWFGPGKWAL